MLNALDPAKRIPRWKHLLNATLWPARGTLVIDEDGAGLVAFANLAPSRDADDDPDVVGEITSFYVAPEMWGQGVGRRLMAASIAALAPGIEVELSGFWTQTPAPSASTKRPVGALTAQSRTTRWRAPRSEISATATSWRMPLNARQEHRFPNASQARSLPAHPFRNPPSPA